MKQTVPALILIVASLAGILVLNSIFIVDETQQAVITQFGEPIGDQIHEPGLHWKTPFIQVIRKFEKRILEWDGDPSQVPTRDKKIIWVDVTGRWRIENALLFLQTMYNERTAQSRLDDIINGITRNYITRHELVDVVRSTNKVLETPKIKEEDDIDVGVTYDKIETGRDLITRDILEAARKVVKDYGIELVDLRIKRINYVQSVQQKVFERMISERKRAAEQLRSEGQGIRAEITGQMGKDLKKITSEAYLKTQKIRGEADGQSIKIYGDAYSKDPQFYAFLSTLERYPRTLKDSRLVLTTDSEFLKYLKKSD